LTSEEFVTFRLTFVLAAIALCLLCLTAEAQIDSVIGQLSNSSQESYAGAMSGDGRFVVFESRGNLATENPRNADGNTEIFLFDYAQRRIFQITDTKSVLYDTTKAATFNNIRVEISNTRPVISNDGRWIAFSSNATRSTPLVPDSTNPGLFNGNDYTGPAPTPTPGATPTPTASPSGTPVCTPAPSPAAPNPLTTDGNLEMWLYQIPPYAAVADLSAGDELPVTNLAPFDTDGNPTPGAAFIRVTNTDPSQMPRAGTCTSGPFIADDSHDASISDDGSVIAFVSTRDLVPAIGNPYPTEDNDEIFTYVRTTNTLGQVTKTPRGPISDPIYSKNPTISGDGSRVAFASTGNNPIYGMTGGSNDPPSRNEEIFYADLIAGSPTTNTVKKQVTTTTPTNPGDPVNILDLGRRMSRDGRYIAFDSFADLANENGGTNYTSFATYLYDTSVTPGTFRRILPRSNADSAAPGGDVTRYPGFTDNNAAGSPSTLVLSSRMNIKPDGTIPTDPTQGLNNDVIRPVQIYSYPLDMPPATAIFTRLAKFPGGVLLATTQLLPSNSQQRMAFNLALTELGTGNFDQLSEAFYFIRPTVINQAPVSVDLATGASGRPISMTPLPTPSPTATATASPTPPPPSPSPSPTATPTGTPTPTPTPTGSPTPPPITPPAVFGLAPGMTATLYYQAGFDRSVVARTAVGSLMRSFTLPIELSGISMTINGAACGLKSVSRHRIEFVVPPGLEGTSAGTSYPLVIHNRGTELKSTVVIVPAQPDIYNSAGFIGPGGRAKIFNVTNTVHTTEPFAVRTIRRKGNMLVPTVLRVYLTGVANQSPVSLSIRIRDSVITGTAIQTSPVLVEPGVYTIDFQLPAALAGAGDQPIIVFVTLGGVTFSSRLDDTAPRLFIL
jgi:Tol biopolymer transport system component/cell division septation protein DedD